MTNEQFTHKKNARIAVSIFFFLSGFTFSTWASRIPDLQKKFQLNDAELGSLLVLLPLGLMLTMPVAGYLLNIYNSKNIMLIGSLLYSLLLGLLGLATKVWELGIILFFFGSFRNLFNISVNIQAVGVQGLFDKSIMTSFHGVWSVAGFAGAAIASLIISGDVSVTTHFLIIGIITFIIITIISRYVLQNDNHPHQRNTAFILPDKPLIKLAIIAFCSMVCEGTIGEWGSIYFEKQVNTSKGFTTLGYICYLCAMTVGRFAGDWAVNNWGVKRILQLSGTMVLTGVGLAILFPNITTAALGFF
ncbi:MFS transporter [Chitinophagaceae bacterium LB-8]|uniref:MFS transporter n=1 Tax=Paraflavisolibacter caeni TaxID=2982496 RepID=A0A9X3BJC4_9BACT|nr:MFS transporter [Paraflavisolibacter caeni]MCU7552622.1 MFS transporter [Paraflavisolibacter caeni]